MDNIDEMSQLDKILNFEKGFIAVHLINIGSKLGIFEVLNNEKGLTVEDLALKTKLHKAYLEIWCQTAYGLEILDCDSQGKFSLLPFLNLILGDKSHYSNRLSFNDVLIDVMEQQFLNSIEYYRSGEKADIVNSIYSERVHENTKNIYLAYQFLIFPQNERLKKMLEQGIKLLDIGCGGGSFIIQLAQDYQNSSFYGIDPDKHGINSANKIISKVGEEDRIKLRDIGGEQLDFKNEFHLITMNFTLHMIPPEVRSDTIEKAHTALRNDGSFLILDFPYPSKIEDFRNKTYYNAIIFQFFEAIGGYKHITHQEINELLINAGFKDIQSLEIMEGLKFLIATK